jgi:transcriptional regulator with XRE-family HTH domain
MMRIFKNLGNPMSLLKEQFGNRLRFLRAERGMTQEQLADKTGLTIESISNIERGIFAPKFHNLEKIAFALKVPVKELFNFE